MSTRPYRRLLIAALAVWGTIGWSAAALADTIPQLPPASVLNQPAPGRSATPQEWTALRTATSQTVALANGHFQTTVYAAPQYWQAPDGSWHTLRLQWQQHANGQWTTPAQPFALTFNPQATGGPALTWQDGPHAVAMTWAHGAPVPPVAANGPQLSLPNVASGLSLTTRVTAGGVAQDWVLASAPTAPITETVTLTDLTPGTPLASGAIPLDDPATGQPVAFIPAPVVSDGQGATLPQAATQTLTATSTPGVYTWTLTPNAATLASAEYPITLDPSVTITPQGSAGQNTFVSQTDPTTNYSTATDFYNGVTSTYGLTRGLVQFENLPVLMPGAVITGAWVRLLQQYSGENAMPINADPVTSAWDASQVNWNNQPTYNSTPVDTESAPTSDINPTYPSEGLWYFNITSLAQGWYAGTTPNDGIELQRGNGDSNYAEWASSYNSTNYNPALVIDWTVDPRGAETGYWASDAGVTLLNGNLTVQNTDAFIPGPGDPLHVTRTFNSLNTNTVGVFGRGWSSTLDWQVHDAGVGPIAVTDSQGLTHVFVETNTDGGTYVGAWAEEHYTLTKSSSGYGLTDLSGTAINFNTAGQETSVNTPAGNGVVDTTTFTRNSTGQITTMTVFQAVGTVANTLTFTYNTAGQVATMTLPNGSVATYTYDTNQNLTNVSWAPAPAPCIKPKPTATTAAIS